jgi:septal ring factor EnvC (AmiA/AmiB activator)
MQAIVSLLIVCVLLGTSLVRCPVTHAQTRQSAQSDSASLQVVTDKIKQQKKKLAQVEKEEAEVISRLNEIEKRLLLESREYESIAEEIKQLLDDIRATRIRMTALEHKSDQQEEVVQQRLSALYKYYRRSGLRILLSSRNYNDLLRTEKALGLIVGRDHDLLSRSLARLKKQRTYESELQSHREQLIAARDRITEKRNQIKSTQAQRSSHLNKIQQEKSLQLKALKELETYSKKLQKVIDTLPGKKKKYTSSGIKFSKKRGRLPFPVKGKITSRFGRTEHPKLKTYTYQKGITIKAPVGKQVKAVHDGRVIFADWFKGYGFMIIVDHGEHYYSLSAHASQLLKKVDDVVFAGETIAHVGDTNSIKGAGLYFEIRLRGKPQNPLKWLKKGGNK